MPVSGLIARCLDDDVRADCEWLPPFDDAHRDAATAAVAYLADDCRGQGANAPA